MKLYLFYAMMVGLVAHAPSHAQGFVDEPTCYSWEGGHKSAGSFSKCGPAWVTAKAPAPAPAPAVVASPVVSPQAPIMMPLVNCAPTPKKPVIKRKPKPPKC